ncbi:hypothetical protein Zm00014a_000503 [Zea mays]|uniref:Transcription factor GTE4 n=1 Tax=Zea mays TaxID=4577 RepID=A0A3L6FK65_MAIZE|nr:Transcription factor GTE4 [Zea mays]PWZ33322.1 hypothetical protein Zm00014a_000503 [Zea mays]PWZ33323.1 hypothetical protein Zm00014a_000503 [Zea mays]
MASGPPSPSGKPYSRKSHASSKAPSVPSFDAHNGQLLPTVTFSLPSTTTARRELRRRLSSELSQVRATVKRLNSLPAPAPSSALSATDPSTPHPPYPPASKHKSKKGGGVPQPHLSAEARRKLYVPVFKTCAVLLSRLMKHKHSWVFNKPVDASALGLHDYHTIITKPMDLGTVKSKLGAGQYKSPREFAGDVRLTFQNAMTYNPKGQDVHFMAEQLLNMFEEKWPEIEAEIAQLSPQPPTPSSAAPKKPKPKEIDNSRPLERSDSTVHAAGIEATPKTHTGRPQVLKKPKAREPNKRDMTFWEKQRLSNNLQDLPPEKLDNVVQIIKKRNLSLSQHDDEIEVDIDSFDVETLWELDRFVTNYRKSITKNKRKAELSAVRPDEADPDQEPEKVEHVRQGKADQDQIPAVQELIPEPETVDVDPPKESAADDNERCVGESSPGHLEDQKGENAGRSSSSGSSSSDSGSSSSDTDTDSSSADGSDAGQSPRT